jgi:monoterpene epsilon-lactone hydrolase
VVASSEAEALWAAFRAAPKMVDMPLERRRAAGEQAEGPTAEPTGVAFETTPSGAILARPSQPRAGAAVLYLFGGGYVLGSPASRRRTGGHIATAAACDVLLADYRLAPEHPFPAALDDAVAAFDEIVALGADPSRTVVCGDSAGGGLALATVLALHRRGTRCAGTVALSPWADLTCSGASMDDKADVDVECTRDSLLAMAAQYLAGHDPLDPLASPVFTPPEELTALAPSLVLVGGDEVLLDDAVRVVRNQGAAGGDATLVVVGGGQHVFPIWCGAIPEADEAVGLVGRWVRDRTA